MVLAFALGAVFLALAAFYAALARGPRGGGGDRRYWYAAALFAAAGCVWVGLGGWRVSQDTASAPAPQPQSVVVSNIS